MWLGPSNPLAFIFSVILCSGFLMPLGARSAQAADAERVRTATPIRHLIVIIGENRSFDHVFGLYRPRSGQTISNLLSRGILDAEGKPGPAFAQAAQFKAVPQTAYYISTKAKAPYSKLPTPVVYGAPATAQDNRPPFKTIAEASAAEPALDPAGEKLLTTGASGLKQAQEIDTRVSNWSALPNGPFQLTGPTLPYDSYTGDTVHRFFQMWQQSDCSVEHAARDNPSGCLSDLYPFVAINWAPINVGGSNSMGVYNVNAADAPTLKHLADQFTLSDNFHQSFMGGTGGNHMMLGSGDDVFFTDAQGDPATPPASTIADPNPRSGTTSRYIRDANWSECSDPSQPGVGPILSYLGRLGLASGCAPGRFYLINNTPPAYQANGALRSVAARTFVPPSKLRTIGDALMEKGISWRYYGGAFDAAVRWADGSKTAAKAIAAAYCRICNPFQYSSSIMTNPAMRAAHLKDVVDLFHDLAGGNLPAVSFVKPDAMLDGHPSSSKLDLFEAFLRNILDRLDANPALAHDTAVFITFDESGGYYDSGYIQPLDFFGDGPRVPFIVVSDFARGGRVVHTYYDHVSILKFIERNWKLKPLTSRSRDNLPDPVMDPHNPYVPRNRPAIGDLFGMFDFTRSTPRKPALGADGTSLQRSQPSSKMGALVRDFL